MDALRLASYVLPRRRPSRRWLAALHGNSFLETITAIAIVAVLAGTAAQTYYPFIAKAAMAEAASLTQAYRVNVAEHLAVTGEFPDETQMAAVSQKTVGRYFDRVDWRDHEVVFELGRGFPGRPRNGEADGPATLSFSVATTPGSSRLLFLCGRATAPESFTAQQARHTSVSEQLLPGFCRL